MKTKINKISLIVTIAFLLPTIILIFVNGYYIYNYVSLLLNLNNKSLYEFLMNSDYYIVDFEELSKSKNNLFIISLWSVGVGLTELFLIYLTYIISNKIAKMIRRDLQLARWKLEDVVYEDVEISSTTGQSRTTLAEKIKIEEVAQFYQLILTIRDKINNFREKEKNAIESLQQVQLLKTRFLATMSHDLRSPLNSILGFSELLLSGVEGELNEEQKKDIKIIYDTGRELLFLINTILQWARIEIEEIQLDREWYPSVEILTSVIEEARSLFSGRNVKLNVELQPGLPPFCIDKDKLVQAILCLINNALKFEVDKEIIIKIFMDNKDKFIVIEVKFHKRLTEEEKESLFEAFYGIDRTDNVYISSDLGLGMALAKAIIEAHGGTLGISVSESQGSSFIAKIPTISK